MTSVTVDGFDIPVLTEFPQVANLSNFEPLPDDWVIGVSDIVNSTEFMKKGGYKTVNFVGAATISAVTNALGGELELFTFAGDGSHFAVPPRHVPKASQALKSVSRWAAQNFDIDLRVGLVPMSEVRRYEQEVSVSMVATSPNVKYAMFTGGGIEWAEDALKENKIRLAISEGEPEPDLTGLSCQWGPVKSSKGTIASLILKQADDASEDAFEAVLSEILSTVGTGSLSSPVPSPGPEVKLPRNSLSLQAAALSGASFWPLRVVRAWVNAVLAWIVFRFSFKLSNFDPDRYRQEIAENSDFRKFSDGLMMTLDCTDSELTWLKEELETARKKGLVNYGLHVQDQALITCVVPSVYQSDHVHFIDGADGGYAKAAEELKRSV